MWLVMLGVCLLCFWADTVPIGGFPIKIHFFFVCTIAKISVLKSGLERLFGWKFEGVSFKAWIPFQRLSYRKNHSLVTIQSYNYPLAWLINVILVVVGNLQLIDCSADSSPDWSHLAQLSLSLRFVVTCHLSCDMLSIKVSCIFFRGNNCHKGVY